MGVIIFATGFLIFNIMGRSLDNLIRDQMENETDEYKKRILRQVDKDFQILNTLAAFLDGNKIKDSDKLLQSLDDAKRQNDFVSISFFNKDRKGIMAHTDRDTETNLGYEDLGEGVPETMEAAFQGKKGISSPFQSIVTKDKIFVYAVPVYETGGSGEVAGVLAASNDVEIFDDILEGGTVRNGAGVVHLMNSEGDILAASTEEDESERTEDLFHSQYFRKSERKKILAAVSAEECIYTSMIYQNRDYHVYLNPVGINGWYIMSVNNHKGVNHVIYKILTVMGAVFLFMLLAALTLLIYTCILIEKTNQNLSYLAYKDQLTGADNMNCFVENLEKARETGQEFCLAALNIHHFKFINEIVGAEAANRILCDISSCISGMLEEGEFYCREIADLFYLFLRETDQSTIQNRMNSMMEKICRKAVIGKRDYRVLLYSGAVVKRRDDLERNIPSELLVTRSRFAMQYARQFPENYIHFYDAEIHKTEELENYVESHMHQALKRGEFKMFLQPQISLENGKMSGAEALARWITDDRRIIYPGIFIPQFEINGFCVQLDMYMAEQAIRQIRLWMDEGLEPVPISINQSKLLFFEPDYIRNLKALIEKYQVPANLITLEILESMALEQADEINRKLCCLRELGFRISMDDFGSGYSSFNTLGNLEIDEIKLDRSFLMEASKDNGDRFCMIIEHIINLTKSLGISTVAEGVETRENEALIRSLGCDLGQGYLYSRPVSAEEFSQKYLVKSI